MNVATNLERSAFFFSDRPAVAFNGRELSYRELDETASRIASSLASSGISPGDHVALCASNSPEWIVFYFGVLKAGAVAVTLSALLSPEELAFLVGHAKPKVVFTDRAAEFGKLRESQPHYTIVGAGGDTGIDDLVKEAPGGLKAVRRQHTDVAAVLYTGGTTGTPKGVMLTHENINTSSHNVAFSERSTEADRALCFLPLNHVFGQMHIMNATILSAGCLELLPSFNLDQVLDILKEGRVTKLFSVPTVYTRLLTLSHLPQRLGAVRYCFSAAASLPAEIIRQWKEVTGLTISEGYGMTESASAVTYNHYYAHVVASVGEAVPGVEVEIRASDGIRVTAGHEGEVCIRGRNIMKGYLDNPEDTKAAFWPDGWFRSGDIGIMDGNGYLFIVDRLKDLIITGGENVYPREVEEALYTHPDIEECAVIGVPDKEWGERVVAFLVPSAGRTVAAGDIKTYLKSKISAFKIPKEYFVMKELPKSPAGKILKRELRKSLLESGSRDRVKSTEGVGE
jgi:long-chain acyl-CoA synthetase